MNDVSSDSVIAGEGLACRRGGRLVFEGLDFRVGPGAVLVVTGANGSGKSTLLRAVAGLLPFERGGLLRNGRMVTGLDPEHHADVVYVGHRNAIKPTLSVRENLGFWARFAGAPGAEDRALPMLGLGALADVRAGELSAGQQRRLALSRLFLGHRTLWLLDEPTVGLDRQNVARLARAMTDHLKAGGAIMAATHVDLGVSEPSIRKDGLDLCEFAPRPGTELEELQAWT